MKITESIDFCLDMVEINKFVTLLVVLIGGCIVFQQYQDYFTFIAGPETVETFFTNYLPLLQKKHFLHSYQLPTQNLTYTHFWLMFSLGVILTYCVPSRYRCELLHCALLVQPLFFLISFLFFPYLWMIEVQILSFSFQSGLVVLFWDYFLFLQTVISILLKTQDEIYMDHFINH